MSASLQECRTVRDLLAGHALNVLAPEEADAVTAHLAGCTQCRDEHDCLAAVAGHLAALRAQRPRTPRQRRRSGRAAAGPSLTLSQWVNSLAYVR
ncbi:zf-HC2 domain-containing protein [Streptomyces sp. NPDC047017]|uniref:zf-HC2 domain-containing protein n=1 Tax=Streptomyces sp. NPDC047017 TaxID=3155024 RepID=UPI00340885E2